MSNKVDSATAELVISSANIVHRVGCAYVNHYQNGVATHPSTKVVFHPHPTDPDYYTDEVVPSFFTEDRRVTVAQLHQAKYRYRACRACVPDIPKCRDSFTTVFKTVASLSNLDIGRTSIHGVVIAIYAQGGRVTVQFEGEQNPVNFAPTDFLEFEKRASRDNPTKL